MSESISGFNASDFIPDDDELANMDNNAVHAEAGSEMFPTIDVNQIGSEQELSGATGQLVDHVEVILNEKADAQITEVVLSQLIYMLCKHFHFPRKT